MLLSESFFFKLQQRATLRGVEESKKSLPDSFCDLPRIPVHQQVLQSKDLRGVLSKSFSRLLLPTCACSPTPRFPCIGPRYVPHKISIYPIFYLLKGDYIPKQS